MSKKIDNLFERFNQLILTITHKSSYQQKKYAIELLEGLFTEITYLQEIIDKMKGTGIDEYNDQLFKSITLNNLLGCDRLDFELIIKDNFLKWLSDKMKSIKKILTFNQILNYARLYGLYCLNYGKEPEKLVDLKVLIDEYELEGYE